MTVFRCVKLPLDQPGLYESLFQRSDPERQRRSERYLRREDGLRCLAAGVLLQDTLRRVLGTGEFTVVKDPGGKPRIEGAEDFHFNLSHSGNRVAIAWGDRTVGVDVQKMEMGPSKEALARRFFTEEEQRYVFAQPEQTELRFYRVWTGKESYLKYLGMGLRKSLASFSIFSPEIARMLTYRYLPEGYCISLCSEDPVPVFEPDDQFLG